MMETQTESCAAGEISALAEFAQAANSSLPLSEKLGALARLGGRLMEADLCMILSLADQAAASSWVVRAAFSSNSDMGGLLGRSLLSPEEGGPGHYIVDAVRGAVEVAPLPLRELIPLDEYATLRSASLTVGNQIIGLLYCYYRRAGSAARERHQRLLTIVASQTALALRFGLYVEEQERAEPMVAFFAALRAGGALTEAEMRSQAGPLGCNLALAHAVVEIEIACCGGPGDAPMSGESRLALYRRILQQARKSLLNERPGSVFLEREHRLTCLLCLSRDPGAGRTGALLGDLLGRVELPEGARVFFGAGNPCHQVSDYPSGFKEAAEALHIGRLLKPGGGVTLFNDLGVTRYLYRIARLDGPPDRFQELAWRIAEYDRERGTDLLDTLDAYLECAGHLTKTSNRLFVHRNTLIQRLERVQSLCGDIDLKNRSTWLQLQLVIKVHKLRLQLG